jgi:hypothetical protein
VLNHYRNHRALPPRWPLLAAFVGERAFVRILVRGEIEQLFRVPALLMVLRRVRRQLSRRRSAKQQH